MTSIFKRKGRKGYALKFRDSTGRWRFQQYPTKNDAQNADARRRELARATEGLEVDQPFPEYAQNWLDQTAVAVRHGTFRSYEWAVKHYLIPTFREQSLRSITPRMVRDMVARLRGCGLDKGSVSNVRSTLHSCLETAVEDRILASNPARLRSRTKLMRMASAGERKANVKAMTAEQARAFLAAADSEPRYRLLFRTMLLSGLRPGEALALQPADVQGGQLRLERAITAAGRVEPCKTDAEGQFHMVDIPDALAAELAALTGRWLFPGATSRRPGHRAALHAFKRILGRAGLPDHFTPHCLRHTYACLHLVAGVSVYYVSRQLRHSDIRITVGTYGSWLPAGNRAASNRLEHDLCHHDVTTPPLTGDVSGATEGQESP
jgi:integrase